MLMLTRAITLLAHKPRYTLSQRVYKKKFARNRLVRSIHASDDLLLYTCYFLVAQFLSIKMLRARSTREGRAPAHCFFKRTFITHNCTYSALSLVLTKTTLRRPIPINPRYASRRNTAKFRTQLIYEREAKKIQR